MLTNVAVSFRPIPEASKAKAKGLLANATVTLPERCTIRDIKIVQTQRGIWAFGPSRPNLNPDDAAKHYGIVDLAEPLRTHILECYKQQFGGADAPSEAEFPEAGA